MTLNVVGTHTHACASERARTHARTLKVSYQVTICPFWQNDFQNAVMLRQKVTPLCTRSAEDLTLVFTTSPLAHLL